MEQMRSVHKYGMTTIDAASTIVKSMELAASVLTQVHEQELNRQGFVENDSSYDNRSYDIMMEEADSFHAPPPNSLDLNANKWDADLHSIAMDEALRNAHNKKVGLSSQLTEEIHPEVYNDELNTFLFEAPKTIEAGSRNKTCVSVVDESLSISSKEEYDKVSQLLLQECKTLTDLGTQLRQQQDRLSSFMSSYLSVDGVNT
jgi:hypothetical protein